MKKEFGKWLMDIAKYIITAVILSSVFGKSDNDESVIYIGGGILSVIIVFWGLYLQKDSKNTSKKKGR
ncbi:MAG: hypothetical protein LBG15_04885 [Dysgonamonadaceae bacterium]|jgi:hypothetical protein|nr:hypothetical protein [Dysgonamonadaceae bacterium]